MVWHIQLNGFLYSFQSVGFRKGNKKLNSYQPIREIYYMNSLVSTKNQILFFEIIDNLLFTALLATCRFEMLKFAKFFYYHEYRQIHFRTNYGIFT